MPPPPQRRRDQFFLQFVPLPLALPGQKLKSWQRDKRPTQGDACRGAGPFAVVSGLSWPNLWHRECSGRSVPCAHAGMPVACVSDARKMEFDCRVPLVLAEAETPRPGLPPPAAAACTYQPRTRPSQTNIVVHRGTDHDGVPWTGSQAGRHKKERARNATPTPTPTRVGMARRVVRDAVTVHFPCIVLLCN